MDYDATEEVIRSNYIRLALVCEFSLFSVLFLVSFFFDFASSGEFNEQLSST